MKKQGIIKKITLFFLLLSFGCLYNAYASEDRVVAVVNDEIITSGEMEMSGTKVFPSRSLSFLIEKKLQLQVARKKGILVHDDEIRETLDDIKKMNRFQSDKEMEEALFKEGVSPDDYRREMKEQLIILKLVSREIKARISVSDKEIEDYYQLHRDIFRLPENIRISYVNIPLSLPYSEDAEREALEKMNKVLYDINQNIPFSELKKKYYNSREINFVNNPGFIKRGDLLPEIENVAFNLKEGESSDVIKTPAGLYIIRLIERKITGYRPLEEVKESVRDAVFQEKSERNYKEWLYNLKSSSYIKIYI